MARSASSRVWLAAALAAGALGCAADSVVLPSESAPAAIEILNGNNQSGTAGVALAESLSVLVTDRDGRPVASRAVSFNVTQDGKVVPASVTTDGEGVARFRWVLASTAGHQTLDVGIGTSGQLSPKATFTAMAEPAAPAELQLVRGDGQTAQVNRQLADSLVVVLLDQYGNPIAGQDIAWRAGSGSVSKARTTTGPDGRGAVLWTLGATVGTQSAEASFPEVTGSPVVFTATATAGAPPRLAIVTQPPTGIVGRVLNPQPVVRLVDDQGNPLSVGGVPVTAAIATGSGSLAGTTTVSTNGSGVAAFTNLAITGNAGTHTLIFAAPGHTATTSDPIDLSNPTPDPVRSGVTVSPAIIKAGTETAQVTVTVRDNLGNPVPGVVVTVSASGPGNTVTQPSGPTGSDGVATASLRSTAAGNKTVSARAGSVDIAETALVSVVAAGPDPAHTTADVPNGKPLRTTTITIFTADAQGNRLTTGGYASAIIVRVTGANNATPTVVDRGDGTYTASYFAFWRGNDNVEITVNGVPIKGSPFKSKVH